MPDLIPITQSAPALERRVMELDARKAALSQAELEVLLTQYYADFCRAAGIGLTVTVRFDNVHTMMNLETHTQLALVRYVRRSCELIFHTQLIAFTDPNAGFVFVGRCWVLLLVLAQVAEINPFLGTNFVFEAGDNGGLPSVSFCSNHPQACLIVDPDFAISAGYAEFRAASEAALVPWERRLPQVLWRGSSTGRRRHDPPPSGAPDDWRWLQRLHLCAAASQPDLAGLCDAGISRVVQIAEADLAQRVAASGLIKPGVPRLKFLEYRYVFDIDGNSNAWSGLFCSLLGGSCVLKVASPYGYRQWYYDRLVPWLNYIPVDKDLGDLAPAVQWAAAHPAHAEQIALRGRELAQGITLVSAVQASAENFIRWAHARVGK